MSWRPGCCTWPWSRCLGGWPGSRDMTRQDRGAARSSPRDLGPASSGRQTLATSSLHRKSRPSRVRMPRSRICSGSCWVSAIDARGERFGRSRRCITCRPVGRGLSAHHHRSSPLEPSRVQPLRTSPCIGWCSVTCRHSDLRRPRRRTSDSANAGRGARPWARCPDNARSAACGPGSAGRR